MQTMIKIIFLSLFFTYAAVASAPRIITADILESSDLTQSYTLNYPALNNLQTGLSTFAAPANQFITGFTSPNTFTSAQPSFSNISGAASLTIQVSGILPIANGGTNNSSAYTVGSVIFSNGTNLAQDNANFFWDDSAFNLKLNGAKFQTGFTDPFARKALWAYDTNQTLELGSWQTDGLPTNSNSEGIIVYGDEALAGVPIAAGDGSYARIKAGRFGLFSVSSTIPFYAGGQYWYRVDPTEIYYRDNAGNKVFNVQRSSGNTSISGSLTNTALGLGIVHSSAGGLFSSSAVDLSSADVTGTLAAGRFPALTGDVTTTAGSLVTTNVGANDSIFNIYNNADNTKKYKWDLSGETTGVTATMAPLNTQNEVYNIQPNVDATANILTQNATSGQIFIGANSSIGGSNSGIQYSNATNANRGQIRLGSYVNAASVAGVTTATSKSGVVGTNSVIGVSQDYSKWTAQAAATTPGSLPISGSFAFKSAASINALTVPTDFHISLENLAGAGVFDRFYLTSEGALALSGYGTGIAHFDASGNVTSSALNLASDVGATVLPIANGGSGQVTANAALNAFLPSQATHGGQVLSTDGTNTSWAAALTNTLTNSHLFVGNGSNVATDVAASGDLTLANTGAFTLNTVNGGVGTFGDASHTVTETVNAKGLVTAVSSNSIQIAESQVTNLVTDLAGKQAAFTWAQETPTGTVNNSNVTFTLAHTPVSNASVHLHQDGLILIQGTDYTISSATITMTTAPNFGQTLYADYTF